jgi:glycine C-acetyltransferase
VSGAGTAAALTAVLEEQLDRLRREGRYKREVVITAPQGAHVDTESGPLLNLCANNYLGLASHPDVIAAAHRALDERGAGMASVRFICGTQDVHRSLERRIAAFLGYDDAVLYTSCFDANVGLFQTFATADDAILSDELNHASIIDGVRLSKARRLVYRHGDTSDLADQLQQAADARLRIVATDGVFSMEGDLARLAEIAALAAEHDALVMVDDSHGVGVVGEGGRGTVAHLGARDGVALQTGTFGKALGGAAGGYVVGPQAAIDLLRQSSRPYLFSNALPPSVVGAAEAALALLESSPGLVEQLARNTTWFRAAMAGTGFEVLPGEHPIVAVMVGDERLALDLAREIRARGVMVVAFTHPVVPVGAARIRVQISAAHTPDDLERAVEAFAAAGAKLGVLPVRE